MGQMYEFPWKCLHCKSIDHQTGLCPLLEKKKGQPAGTPTVDKELLPLDPTPGPSCQPPNPNHGKRTEMKGKEVLVAVQPSSEKPKAPSKTNAVHTNGMKKCKV